MGLEVAVWSENQCSEVRCAAAKILGNLGEHAAPAVPELTKCLADKNSFVRRGGFNFVRTGAIAGRRTAAGIAAQNTDPACDSCSLATRSAGCTDVGLEVAVWSGNQSSEVRYRAASALGKLGEYAAPAVPALTKCVADEDCFVRGGGLCALARSQAGAQLRQSQLKTRTQHATVAILAQEMPVVRM